MEPTELLRLQPSKLIASESVAKQGDNWFGSGHLSVCLFPLSWLKRSTFAKSDWIPVQGICLVVCNLGAYVDNLVDAVEQL